jgi:hypothetical protein
MQKEQQEQAKLHKPLRGLPLCSFFFFEVFLACSKTYKNVNFVNFTYHNDKIK